MSAALERAERAACRAIIREHSKSFFLASKLLPASVREDATAMYAFCRVADDAIDAAPSREAAMAGLMRMRERLAAIYGGLPLHDPVDRAFARVVHGHGIPRSYPEALLRGLETDARGERIRDERELVTYAFRVASSVGLMMAQVLGAPRSARLRAADLGVAMQLTNIARDVGEDARRGRVYLPETWLTELAIAPESLAREATPAARTAVRRLLALADGHYAASMAGLPLLPPDARLAIASAGEIYAAIGSAVAARGYDSVSARAHVPLSRKLRLVGRAWWKLGQPLIAPAGPHDALLGALIADADGHSAVSSAEERL